jgi:glutathione peroxidase
VTEATTVDALYAAPVRTLEGGPADLGEYRDRAVLIVNVASKCGLTPQYEGLERLQERFAGRGFSVLGFPCNQFGEQEPGSAEEIRTFCSTTYGVTFPMFEKIEVNGPGRHPLYGILTPLATAKGTAATSAGTSRSSSSRRGPRASRGSRPSWSRRRSRSSRRSRRRCPAPDGDAIRPRRRPAAPRMA